MPGTICKVTVVTLSGETLCKISLGSTSNILEILDELVQLGEHRICTLIHDTDMLNPTDRVEAMGSLQAHEQVTAMFWTAEGLKNMGLDVNKLMGPRSASEDAKALRAAQKLKVQGAYTPQELRASGFTVRDLQDAGYGLATLKSGGYSVRECMDASYTVGSLVDAGFPPSSFKDAGCTAKELFDAGFTVDYFRGAGYDLRDLRELISCSAGQVKSGGYTLAQVKAAGYTAAQLKIAGYPLAQVKAVGYTLVELKEAGYAVWVLAASGYSIAELRRGGFTDQELVQAGLKSPSEGNDSGDKRRRRTQA
mmetsp:Transcript_88073/g.152570  ORF Transcript_88073/g.152570 Transcript_88073/m.152570 type:complete len:308 (-) Transcript_88073:97-1020(-)